MWSQRDPSLRKSGVGNIFIKNLHESVKIADLIDDFGKYGNILSCKIVCDPSGKSKGYGFVHYDKEISADNAIKEMNDKEFKGKKLFVGHFLPKRERNKQIEGTWTNVFVKNLDADIDEDSLKEAFQQHGRILSVAIVRDDKNVSKGFGFINFESHEQATAAVQALHSTQLGSKEIWCGRHQKRAEREAEKKRRKAKYERSNRTYGTNLYIKNLEDDIDDGKLKKEFSGFGVIRSAKVMLDDKGQSKGFGFICFSTPEEARNAIETMHNNVLPGYSKPLYVAHHEPMEFRRQKLIQHFSRKNNPNPQYFYPPGGVPQNLVYPQYPPPMARPPFGPGYRGYPINTMNPSRPPARASQPIKSGRSNQQNRPRQQEDTHSSTLQSLMSLPEDQRKLYLGEQLYPLIYNIDQELAGKITGMLLDSGWTVENLTQLLSDRNLLNSKVQEAKEVLERASKDSK
jgi:polyadenylate-binding protein